MKAFKLIQHIEKQGLDNSLFNSFTMPNFENSIEFVKRYFGGDFIAGWLEKGENYVAFWGEDNKPEGIADAVVSDDNKQKIYIYHAE